MTPAAILASLVSSCSPRRRAFDHPSPSPLLSTAQRLPLPPRSPPRERRPPPPASRPLPFVLQTQAPAGRPPLLVLARPPLDLLALRAGPRPAGHGGPLAPLGESLFISYAGEPSKGLGVGSHGVGRLAFAGSWRRRRAQDHIMELAVVVHVPGPLRQVVEAHACLRCPSYQAPLFGDQIPHRYIYQVRAMRARA